MKRLSVFFKSSYVFFISSQVFFFHAISRVEEYVLCTKHVFFTPVFQKIQPEYRQIFRGSVTFSRRERFVNQFFCVEPHVPHVFLTCACFFLFVCTCARMCAHTRPREIHNVGLFPSVFERIKKRSPATVSFTVVYKKIFKISSKKYCVKVAEAEKVRTFATAFERESR